MRWNMTREQDIIYQQALDVVAGRMLHGPIATLHQLLEAVEATRARHKATRGRKQAAQEMSEEDIERRRAELCGRANSTRVDSAYAADVATGRAPHPMDKRI